MSTEHNIELAYASLAVIADDGTIDMHELNFLLGLALRDGEIGEGEKRILDSVFAHVNEEMVTLQVWERIQAVRKKYGIVNKFS